MKTINLSKINIPQIFLSHQPRESKIKRKENFYCIHNRQDKPLVLDEENNLIDGYATYIALLNLGISKADCVLRTDLITYVYGRHINGSRKEYVWELPNNISSISADVGDIAYVKTQNGISAVCITKIEKLLSPPLSNVKSVVGIVKSTMVGEQ